jgi:ribosomal protein S6--L-glutamate ligase
MKFLVLNTGRSTSKHLLSAITLNGHQYDIKDPRYLYSLISEADGYDRIYDGYPSHDVPIRMNAKDYDAIICRIGSDLYHSVAILRHLTDNMGIYTPHNPLGLIVASDKFWTLQSLSHARVKVPLSVFSNKPSHVSFFVDKLGGLPVVAKTLTGSQGKGVMIYDSVRSANTSLEGFNKEGIPIKLQRYIEASGKDIRAIVVGDKVVSAMERSSGNDKEFRANLSKGGTGDKVLLSEEEKAMCVKASQALGLEFSGVDLIRDVHGKAYCSEVNGNPGTGIIDVTGHNHFMDLVMYIEQKIGKPQNHSIEAPKEAPKEAKADLMAQMPHSAQAAFSILGFKRT